jgi:hypothetical protein
VACSRRRCSPYRCWNDGLCHWLLLQVLEIKRLTAAIATLKSELGKHQERLEECKRCGTLHSNGLGSSNSLPACHISACSLEAESHLRLSWHVSRHDLALWHVPHYVWCCLAQTR